MEQRVPLQQGGPLVREREHSFGEPGRSGVRGLDSERHRIHPDEPLENIPQRPLERPGSRMHRGLPTLLLQPGEHLAGKPANATGAVAQRDDDLRFTPHAGGKHRFQSQA